MRSSSLQVMPGWPWSAKLPSSVWSKSVKPESSYFSSSSAIFPRASSVATERSRAYM